MKDCRGHIGHTTTIVKEGVLVWGPQPHMIDAEITMDELYDAIMEVATDDPYYYIEWYELGLLEEQQEN